MTYRTRRGCFHSYVLRLPEAPYNGVFSRCFFDNLRPIHMKTTSKGSAGKAAAVMGGTGIAIATNVAASVATNVAANAAASTVTSCCVVQ
jgi:hypothetical protein